MQSAPDFPHALLNAEPLASENRKPENPQYAQRE
jgi:hypothetical protein